MVRNTLENRQTSRTPSNHAPLTHNVPTGRKQNGSFGQNKAFVTLVAIIAVVIALFAFVLANGFHIEFKEADSIVLDYGQQTDITPKAVVKGRILFRNGVEISKVKVDKAPDTKKLGKQKLKASASCLWMKANTTVTVKVEDKEPPVITLKKAKAPTEYGAKFKEPGYKAVDNVDGNITKKVTAKRSKGTITYTVKDSSGNKATVKRKIKFVDTTPPVIRLYGYQKTVLSYGEKFNEPGFTAEDIKDGDITSKVTSSGKVNSTKPGSYTITYSVKDAAGNSTQLKRTVTVLNKTEEPTNAPQPNNPQPPKAPQQPGNPKPTSGKKTIYLTFDDGPSQYTPRLLDVLKKYNVKATFFVVGKSYPETLKRIHREGHAIGLHSLTHDYKKIYSSTDNYFNDLNQLGDYVQKTVGIRPKLIRFPGGSSNAVSKKYCPGIMTALTKQTVAKGYSYVDWNITSGDAGETTSTSVVYSNIIRGIERNKVPIVLQHDSKSFSISAVEDVIKWSKAKGYEFDIIRPGYPVCHHRVNN